jgi:hypothetical protein
MIEPLQKGAFMKAQHWIFTIRYTKRCAVVGPARASTVEAALHLAKVPESVRAEIRSNEFVRRFVEGRVDPDSGGYTNCDIDRAPDVPFWDICVGSVQAILP